MSNPNFPLPASPVRTMPPSDDEPMLSDEDDTSSVDEETIYSKLETIESRRGWTCSCVFWDVMDFPFPKGVDPLSIKERITSFLQRKGPVNKLSIIAYADDDKEYDAYKEAGFTFRSPPKGICDARARFMLVDIAIWTSDHPSRKFNHVMVISKRIETNWVFLDYLICLSTGFYRVSLTHDELPISRKQRYPGFETLPLHFVSFKCLLESLSDDVESIADHKRESIEETSSVRQKLDKSS